MSSEPSQSRVATVPDTPTQAAAREPKEEPAEAAVTNGLQTETSQAVSSQAASRTPQSNAPVSYAGQPSEGQNLPPAPGTYTQLITGFNLQVPQQIPSSTPHAAPVLKPGTASEPASLQPGLVPQQQAYRVQQQYRPNASASLANGAYVPYNPHAYGPRQQVVAGARGSVPLQQGAVPPRQYVAAGTLPQHVPQGAYPLHYQGGVPGYQMHASPHPLPAGGAPAYPQAAISQPYLGTAASQQLPAGASPQQSPAGPASQQLPPGSHPMQYSQLQLQQAPAGSLPQQIPGATPRFPVSLAQLGIHASPGRGPVAANLPPYSQGMPQNPAMGPFSPARPPLSPQGAAVPGLPAGWRGYPFAPTTISPVLRGSPIVGTVGASPPLLPLQTVPPASPASSTPKKPPTRKSQNAPNAKKHCNCKNSRCLKLYCECFASGRYCDNCNCVSCCNNKENETFRQAAVETILDRNPNAFRPKIQEREGVAAAVQPARHNKGCNCKKSGCLKKYCECFQASIYCSENCKCVDCKNYNIILGPKSSLASSKLGQKDGKAVAHLGAGSFTEAMNEAIADGFDENPAVTALRETMQEVVKGNGIFEMAKLLLLVADEESDAAEPPHSKPVTAQPPENAAAQGPSPSASEPAGPSTSLAPNAASKSIIPPKSRVRPRKISEEYARQERAVLSEFHGFLEKLVKKVQKRAAEHEAASNVPQASASPQSENEAAQEDTEQQPGPVTRGSEEGMPAQSEGPSLQSPPSLVTMVESDLRRNPPLSETEPMAVDKAAEAGISEGGAAEAQDIDMTTDETLDHSVSKPTEPPTAAAL